MADKVLIRYGIQPHQTTLVDIDTDRDIEPIEFENFEDFVKYKLHCSDRETVSEGRMALWKEFFEKTRGYWDRLAAQEQQERSTRRFPKYTGFKWRYGRA